MYTLGEEPYTFRALRLSLFPAPIGHLDET